MADNRDLDRRTLLQLGGAGAVGAIAGFLAGRATAPQPPAPVPTPTPGGREFAAGATPFTWSLDIQGGYGWLFRADRTIKVMSLKSSSCHFFDHEMKLFIDPNLVQVVSSTDAPQDDGGLKYWPLEGDCKFAGMPGKGVTQRTPTPVSSLDPRKPYPKDPLGPGDWDDQVWLSEREKAKSNVDDYASRSIVLTDGTLSVLQPSNIYGVLGYWHCTKADGTTHAKSLTDRLQLTGGPVDNITIDTHGGAKKIVLRPANSLTFMAMGIRRAATLQGMPFTQGQALDHFAMLYEFVEGADCSKVKPPVYEPRPGFTIKDPSPGDLCPGMMLNA